MVIGELKDVFGSSTGETGGYGVGDIVQGKISDVVFDEDGGGVLKGEPCHSIFIIRQSEWGQSIQDIAHKDVEETKEYYGTR